AGRLARLKALIAAAPPGSVSVDGLARASGTSRSVLYRLFQGEGGLLAYDRRRRLLALYRDLVETGEHEPIARVAERHGFADTISLGRGFRALFGCSPREVRVAARGEAPAIHPDQVPEVIRRMVARLH
uniref:helix-turn-helix domain-containing protein n=1 Tax=Sphingomonas bacterium TaxID=1895847 RepID=UPI0015767FDB